MGRRGFKNKDELHKYLVEVAAKSPCQKRKVGAVVVYEHTAEAKPQFMYTLYAEGFNFHPDGTCETMFDGKLVTKEGTVHAEDACMSDFKDNIRHIPPTLDLPKGYVQPFKMFVTHQPCSNCLTTMEDMPYEVVGDFLKFDSNKLRMELIPPKFLEEIAKVYTYGASKYKPNNWQKTEDAYKAYAGAAMRHFEAWRSGEMVDPESGLLHLAQAATNLSFLIHLDTTSYFGEQK